MGIMASRGKYKPVDYYQQKVDSIVDGFESFSDEGMYYFTCNKKGEVFIISEGYTSSSARNRGIQSVAKNLMLAAQYHFETLSDNHFCFTLKAGNNQEIAKSKIFKTEDAMHAFIGWIIGKRFSVNLINEENIDENLTIGKNGNDPVLTGIYSNQIDYFIFKGTNGKQYFSFKNKAGKTLLLNTNVRGYENIETINKILAEVLQFAPNINNYDFKLTKNGKYYFYLKNSQSSNIAKSTFFATEEEMMEVIQLLTLVNMEASITPKNNDIEKSIGIQSHLFSEIDNNGKGQIFTDSSEQNISSNKIQNQQEKAVQKPIDKKQEIVEDEPAEGEDEFTALLKQQQQAELEVRLKREKEEKDRKDKQNQYAKANAEVLRKHKEEQSIELDEKLKQEDSFKAKKVDNNKPAKPEISQEALPHKVVKGAGKPKVETKQIANETKTNIKENTSKTKSPEITETVKRQEAVIKSEPAAEKKQVLEKQTKPKVAKTEKISQKETSVETKPPVKKPAPITAKETSHTKSGNDDYDPEIEKAKIAAQARFDELKKAAEFRKRKEKDEQPLKTTVEKDNIQNDNKSYDWWTKKEEDSSSEDFILDAEIDNDSEPIALLNILKPALIGLLVLTLLFVGFRSFKSSDKNSAVATNVNVGESNSATAVNTNSSTTDNNYYNTTLPENFANVEKGSIEWHIINCIVNTNCPQEQSYQWIETNFQSNSTYLSSDALQSLDNIALILKEYTNTRLDIFGHITNNEKDNFTAGKSLSEQRAKQVKDLLVERGVPSDRLSFKGLAKTRPIQAGNSLTAHHYNKRIELILFKTQQSL